jgi:hypothetical protein
MQFLDDKVAGSLQFRNIRFVNVNEPSESDSTIGTAYFQTLASPGDADEFPRYTELCQSTTTLVCSNRECHLPRMPCSRCRTSYWRFICSAACLASLSSLSWFSKSAFASAKSWTSLSYFSLAAWICSSAAKALPSSHVQNSSNLLE